jgi:hypothetical protein
MITHDLATAQILFILVSDSRSQLNGMTHDLQRSRYRYFFAHHADKPALVESVRQRIAGNGGRVPTVLLINGKFARKECVALLELARGVAKSAAIECVVTHPPALESQRKALLALGARLFDGDDGMAVAEHVLH